MDNISNGKLGRDLNSDPRKLLSSLIMLKCVLSCMVGGGVWNPPGLLGNNEHVGALTQGDREVCSLCNRENTLVQLRIEDSVMSSLYKFPACSHRKSEIRLKIQSKPLDANKMYSMLHCQVGKMLWMSFADANRSSCLRLVSSWEIMIPDPPHLQGYRFRACGGYAAVISTIGRTFGCFSISGRTLFCLCRSKPSCAMGW